jgi:XTP/dITP diphosphohydrolase
VEELRALAADHAASLSLDLRPLPGIAELPSFEESSPTFAENAAGKALHYSRWSDVPVIADDSGLVVPALGGAPGVHSARYAGPNASDHDRIAKLLKALGNAGTADRTARFVCVIAAANRGRILAVVSDKVEGCIARAPRGSAGFGYDPVFLLPESGKTFAELTREEKNRHSHRGKAFRKLLHFLAANPVL